MELAHENNEFPPGLEENATKDEKTLFSIYKLIVPAIVLFGLKNQGHFVPNKINPHINVH